MDVPTFPNVTLWHNPDCSKSRRAFELLDKTPCEVTVREYLSDPPSAEELSEVAAMMGKSPRDLARRKEALYTELGLDDVDEPELLEALAANPILIERPIAIAPSRGVAVLGRPLPELVLHLLAPSLPEGMSADDVLRRVAQGKLT